MWVSPEIITKNLFLPSLALGLLNSNEVIFSVMASFSCKVFVTFHSLVEYHGTDMTRTIPSIFSVFAASSSV
jgi:hypothetical protein